MKSLTFHIGKAHAVLSRRGHDVLLVVHTTPHLGSSAFMRQLARHPMLRAPQEREVERRLVGSADAAVTVLNRHGVVLNPAQRQELQACFAGDRHATP